MVKVKVIFESLYASCEEETDLLQGAFSAGVRYRPKARSRTTPCRPSLARHSGEMHYQRMNCPSGKPISFDSIALRTLFVLCDDKKAVWRNEPNDIGGRRWEPLAPLPQYMTNVLSDESDKSELRRRTSLSDLERALLKWFIDCDGSGRKGLALRSQYQTNGAARSSCRSYLFLTKEEEERLAATRGGGEMMDNRVEQVPNKANNNIKSYQSS